MNVRSYHSVDITTRTGMLWHNGVIVRSSDHVLLAELIERIHSIASGGKIEERGRDEI